jgi:LysM repeat protein
VLKGLTAAAILFCVFISSCASTIKPARSKEAVLIHFVCETEEQILQLATYDRKSAHLAAQYFMVLITSNQCIRFQKPMMFTIEEVLGEYTDFAKDTVSVVKVSKPDNPSFKGYVILVNDKLKNLGTIKL